MFSLHIAWDRAGGVPGRQGVTKKAEQIARREKSCEFRNLQVLSCQRVLGVQQRHCFCLQIFKIYNKQSSLKKTAVCSIYFVGSFTTPVYSKLLATAHPCYVKSHRSFLLWKMETPEEGEDVGILGWMEKPCPFYQGTFSLGEKRNRKVPDVGR